MNFSDLLVALEGQIYVQSLLIGRAESQGQGTLSFLLSNILTLYFCSPDYMYFNIMSPPGIFFKNVGHTL